MNPLESRSYIQDAGQTVDAPYGTTRNHGLDWPAKPQWSRNARSFPLLGLGLPENPWRIAAEGPALLIWAGAGRAVSIDLG
jgi:hypothetical protein